MDETRTCERCGDEYEAYPVLIRDDITDISGMLQCEYDALCKPCRMEVTNYGAFLTESEKEELEPKTEIE